MDAVRKVQARLQRRGNRVRLREAEERSNEARRHSESEVRLLPVRSKQDLISIESLTV